MEGRDPRTADLRSVRSSYGARAAEYIERFGDAEQAPEEDRRRIGTWAGTIRGRVLDAGSGPGHWTRFLADRGLDAEGVDATPEFVAHATRTHPGTAFRVGDLRSLDIPARSLGGVLAWYSLIHLDPHEVPAVLSAFAAALRPGGGLLLGFFGGTDRVPFDHQVATAWAWPLRGMVAAVEDAGFVVDHGHEQPQPTGRVFAALVAHLPGADQEDDR